MIVEVSDDDYNDGDSCPSSPEVIVIRDKTAEDTMIRLLAAETIQYAYRRFIQHHYYHHYHHYHHYHQYHHYHDQHQRHYHDYYYHHLHQHRHISCKAAKKMKRVKSTDLLVKTIAADTIIKGIKHKIALNKTKSKHADDKAFYDIGEEKTSINYVDNNEQDTKVNDRKQMKSDDEDIHSTILSNTNDSAPKSNRYEYFDAKESKESKDSKESKEIAPEVAKPPLFPLDIKFESNSENKRTNKKKDTRLKGNIKSKRQEKLIEVERKLEEKEVIQEISVPNTSKSVDTNYNISSGRDRSVNSASVDTKIKKPLINQEKNEIYVNKFAPPVPLIESPPDRYRVIDEAFSCSLNAQCSMISLQTHEIAMVLDALGYELNDSISELKKRALETIEVPMLSNAPLAAVLSFHGRNKSLVKDLENFTVSEQMANVAVKHLSSLVQGSWLKVRSLLLKYFNLPKDQIIRPALWPSNWILEFTKALQFPEKNFAMISGKVFLEIPKSFLKDVYNIIPSLLQARFVLYQHLFRLLDEWWDKGFRPNDLYKDKDSSKKSTKSARKQESLKIIKASENWGKFEGKYSLHFDNEKINTKINVEICHFQMLLDTLVPLNRAYGWGIQLERLTLLCGKVSGLKGFISIQNPNDRDIKGCRWVTLHKPIQTTDDLVEVFPDSLYSKIKEFYGEIDNILIPISCMRPIGSNEVAIKLEDIKVGTIVKVISEDSLRQSLERFDWWDRPSTNTQNSILGLVGEVISISELTSRQRVGVRFHEKNIIDALPVDALVIVEGNDNSARNESIQGSYTSQKVEKKKKDTSKKSKKKVSNADAAEKLSKVVVKNDAIPVTIIPPLPLETISSTSPMTLKIFSKADKLFRAVETLDFGSGKESKEEEFILSDRINTNTSNANNMKPRPSTAKERRLYRPIMSEEPKVPSLQLDVLNDDMAEEKKWVRDFSDEPIDANLNDNDVFEEEPNTTRYSWMKSIEIIPKNSPRNEEVKNTSPDSNSPRSKAAKLSIYQPQFTEDDYHNPVSPKRRPKSAPNKRDRINEKNGPRIYNKMISHDNDYEPDQLPEGGPSLIYEQPFGVAGRNIKKVVNKENDNLIYTPEPYIPEPPKFKYIPKTKEAAKSKEIDINQVLDSNQIGILGYAFGKNPDEIAVYTNTNVNENKKKKKQDEPIADETIVSKKNNKSLGSYLIQQQFAGDFLDGILHYLHYHHYHIINYVFIGQNLNVVANIAVGIKIADNAEQKTREELLAIELAKNEKLFERQGNYHHHPLC